VEIANATRARVFRTLNINCDVWPLAGSESTSPNLIQISQKAHPFVKTRAVFRVTLAAVRDSPMTLLANLERLHSEARRNKWFRYFAGFCRIALALGFIPAGLVKVSGERFTALPSNHPLGHYFDALYLTGSYYTFVGIGQLTAALMLLIPRTALLGAIVYFPIILNICVLTYAVRFEGTRIATLMLLANLFLLAWDYDRLKHVLPFRRANNDRLVVDQTSKFPVLGLACVFAAVVSVIVVNHFLYDIRPGNSRVECTNGCNSGNPTACQLFCSCIYDDGTPLNACLDQFQKARETEATFRRAPTAAR
jgi:uncharacterized membrane protein YphA (DoxX/SURF4 family)